MRLTSLASSSKQARIPSICAFRQRRDCTTGFGTPVLPPLNLMICGSCSARGTWAGRCPAHLAARPRTLGNSFSAPNVLATIVGAPVGVSRSRHDSSATSSVGTVAAILAVNLGFAVRATPGNVGVFQAAYALIAVAFGMDKDQAIAVAFLIQTQQIIPITLIGVAMAPEFIFRRKKVVRAEDRGMDLHSRNEQAEAV